MNEGDANHYINHYRVSPDHLIGGVHPDTLGSSIVEAEVTALANVIAHGDKIADKIEAQALSDPENRTDLSDIPKWKRPAKLALIKANVLPPKLSQSEKQVIESAKYVDFEREEQEIRKAEHNTLKENDWRIDKLRERLQRTEGAERTRLEGAVRKSLSRFQAAQMNEWLAENNGKPGSRSPLDWLLQDRLSEHLGEPMSTQTAREFAESGISSKYRDYLKIREEDNARLVNFLQYNYDKVRSTQHEPELRQAVEKEKAEWAAEVEQGVAEGWLDKSATQRATELGSLKVYSGDIFSLDVKETGGYHERGTRHVVVGPDATWATKHELNHALLWGGTMEVSSSLDESWVDEALTEHIALVMKGRTPVESMDLAYGAYKEERQLLKSLIDGIRQLGGRLSIADFTRAYSATGETRESLVQEINNTIHDTIQGTDYNWLAMLQAFIDGHVRSADFKPELEGRARVAAATRLATTKFVDELVNSTARQHSQSA